MIETAQEGPQPHADTHSAADRSIVVIGAGQAGLATGYFLRDADLDFTILADDEQIGDPWRNR